MELGNMVFGNSRGEYPLPRDAGFEKELFRLFDVYAPRRDNCWREYGEEFNNETFSVFPYYWGDCTCGADDSEEYKEHSNDCLLVKPNFLHKPSGFEIQWYKYPLRDSYTNQKITLNKFREIIDDCIKSVQL